MKKNIVLLTYIVILFLVLVVFKIEIPKNKQKLAGTKISENIYSYNLKTENELLQGYYIKKDNIYYLISALKNDLYTYKVYKENIYTLKKELISTLKETESYCTLENDYINCSNEEEIKIYNYKFKELYKGNNELKDKEYNNINIIPYKDTFLEYKNNNLYLKQNNVYKKFRVIEEFNEYFVHDYFYYKDNTNILFFNDQEFYLYDINKKKSEKINVLNVKKYEEGFYFYDEEKIIIYNLKENQVKEYSNLYQADFLISEINKNNLYIYDYTDNVIKIINLENKTIKRIKLEITKEVNNLKVTNNYLYFNTFNDNIIYLIDLENIELEEIKMEENIETEEDKLIGVLNSLNETYKVNIKTKEETNIEYPDFSVLIESNNNTINEALNKIEQILAKYNKEFFDVFYYNDYKGLNIYLTSTLTPSDYDTQVANPAAYSLVYNNEYMIVIDINQTNIEELLCHELMHNIEFNLNNNNIYSFLEWDKYNPSEFYYNYSYTKEQIFGYTLSEQTLEKVYFIDNYSHTYPEEDRARVFESICAYNENSIVKKYPNLYSKALYLKEEIINNYPSLKSTNLFNSLN